MYGVQLNSLDHLEKGAFCLNSLFTKRLEEWIETGTPIGFQIEKKKKKSNTPKYT